MKLVLSSTFLSHFTLCAIGLEGFDLTYAFLEISIKYKRSLE